jgi:hypothetical protein
MGRCRYQDDPKTRRPVLRVFSKTFFRGGKEIYMKYYLFILLFTSLSLLPAVSYSESNVDLKEESRKSELQVETLAVVIEDDTEVIMVTATRTETPVSQVPNTLKPKRKSIRNNHKYRKTIRPLKIPKR